MKKNFLLFLLNILQRYQHGEKPYKRRIKKRRSNYLTLSKTTAYYSHSTRVIKASIIGS